MRGPWRCLEMRHSEFKSRQVEFCEAPLWMWNDKLTDQEFLRQLDELDKTGRRTVFTAAVTDAFLECTYERYARSVGTWFGSTIPGVFTYEPQFYIGRLCDLAWVKESFL